MNLCQGVMYQGAPGCKVDLVRAVCSRVLLGIPSTIKKLLEAINVYCSGMTRVNPCKTATLTLDLKSSIE